MTWRVIEGDCIETMREMPESSVDAVVTDPPYGLEFMGKEWDRLGDVRQIGDATFKDVPTYAAKVRHGYGVDWRAMQEWHHAWAVEVLRVLKPGGHLLAFGGTRTYHRLTCALEDAGFEIRDCLAWLYGSGFPKSLDVSKAIDKAAGAEREVVGSERNWGASKAADGKAAYGDYAGAWNRTAPATSDALRWQGWGTALKPAFEPIVLARKPLAERNVAANVLEYATGALNIDGARIETNDIWSATGRQSAPSVALRGGADGSFNVSVSETHPAGRWPANVVLDEEAAAILDEQTGEHLHSAGFRTQTARRGDSPMFGLDGQGGAHRFGDSGGASRFFYTAKADRAEREVGRMYGAERNGHPTVKPVDLMCWLVRLVTPPGGTVLDPFTGSGTTGIAALREGFSFVGIEREPEYVEIARARIIGDAPMFNVAAEATP